MMTKELFFMFVLYLARWQLSSPTLYVTIKWMKRYPKWAQVVTANFIGGCLFFWIDKLLIFR